MLRVLTVEEVMTPSPITIAADELIMTATRLMYKHNIRHLPVIDGDELIGILTDRDVKLAAAVRLKGDQAGLRVDQVCVLDPYIVEATEPLDRVAGHLARERIGSALVQRNGKLVGIFTVTDACKALEMVLQPSVWRRKESA